MKLQDVILKAVAKKLTWTAAVEIELIGSGPLRPECARKFSFESGP
jgi:hypothetical protein